MKKLYMFAILFAVVLTACDRGPAEESGDISTHTPDTNLPAEVDCRVPGSLGDPSQRDVDRSLPICEESDGAGHGPVSLVPEVTDKVTESNPYEEGGIIYPPADTDEAMLRLAEFTRFYDDDFWGYALDYSLDVRVGDRYPFFPDLECDFRSIKGEPVCYETNGHGVYTFDDLKDWLPYVLNVDVMAAVAAGEVTCYRICVAETGHLVGLLQDDMDDWLRQYCPGGQCGANAARFGYN